MTHRRSPLSRRGPKGFSLLEILISASLLTIVGALLLQTLSSSIDAKDQVEKTSGRYHLVRSAMSRMVDEISMAYISGHVAALDPRNETGFVGEREELNFTAFGYVPRVADEKKSDQRQLGYLLDHDRTSGTQSLMRREQANIDDDFKEGGRTLVLLPDVRELEFQYWDKAKESWEDKWDFEAPERSTDPIPERVRIKIVAVMDDGEPMTFVTQTRLFLLRAIKF